VLRITPVAEAVPSPVPAAAAEDESAAETTVETGPPEVPKIDVKVISNCEIIKILGSVLSLWAGPDPGFYLNTKLVEKVFLLFFSFSY